MYEITKNTTAGITGLAVVMGGAPVHALAQETTVIYHAPDIYYRWLNLSVPIEADVPPPIHDLVVENYRPRTPLGERLLALRREYLNSGGTLLNWDELDDEMRSRRGGVADE